MWLLLLLTIDGSAWTQDTTGCQINQASSKTQPHPLCVSPGVYLCLYLQIAWCCSEAQVEGILRLWLLTEKRFLIHCTHPLLTSTARSLKLTRPLTPVVLSATRTSNVLPDLPEPPREHSRPENKTNQKAGQYLWAPAGAANSGKQHCKESGVQVCMP